MTSMMHGGRVRSGSTPSQPGGGSTGAVTAQSIEPTASSMCALRTESNWSGVRSSKSHSTLVSPKRSRIVSLGSDPTGFSSSLGIGVTAPLDIRIDRSTRMIILQTRIKGVFDQQVQG